MLSAHGIAQVQEHAPGLELVDHVARQADRCEDLERALEILRADLLLERLAIEEHGGFEETLPRVRVGHELEHQALRRIEPLAHHGRKLGEPRVGDVDRAVDVARCDTFLFDAPEQSTLEAAGMGARREHGEQQRRQEGPAFHRLGPIIASARTQRSKSCALT